MCRSKTYDQKEPTTQVFTEGPEPIEKPPETAKSAPVAPEAPAAPAGPGDEECGVLVVIRRSLGRLHLEMATAFCFLVGTLTQQHWVPIIPYASHWVQPPSGLDILPTSDLAFAIGAAEVSGGGCGVAGGCCQRAGAEPPAEGAGPLGTPFLDLFARPTSRRV